MTLPSSIRINMPVPFPARVQGTGGILVSKSLGIWTVTPNFSVLADLIPPASQWTNTFFWAYNSTNQTYYKVSIESIHEGINAEAAIGVVMGDGSALIAPGIGPDIPVPFDCEIVSATLVADGVGSIVVDVWRDSYANFPPVVGDSICAAAKPTLAAANKSQDTTLTGWTTALTAGDILRFNIDSVAGLRRVTLSLEVNRA